jgi:hypothetical protein
MSRSARSPQNGNDLWSRYLVRACVAAVVVVLTGCSGSSSTTTAPATARTASGPAASPSPASLPQLKAIVLRAADLPTGWLGTPHKADPNTAATDAALAKCVGGVNTDRDQVADAHSADFALAGASISSSASSYRSQSDVASDIAMLHSPKLNTCFNQQLVKQLATSLPKGATIESASVKITPGSAGGPANVIANGTGSIKVAMNSQQAAAYVTAAFSTGPVIYISVAFITGPLIEAEVDTSSIGMPVPASMVKSLVAEVANRAANR